MPQGMTRAPYVLDDQIGYILRRVTQRHLAIFAQAIPDVTTTQFAVLMRLAELGPQSQNALGRETAMDAATRNSADMIEGLTLTMNKVRQAAITREIIEVVSGAQAL